MDSNKPKPERVQLTKDEAVELKADINNSNLSEKNKYIVLGVIDFSIWLQNSLQKATITIRTLRGFFGFKSEKKNSSNKSDDEITNPPPDLPEENDVESEVNGGTPRDSSGEDASNNKTSHETENNQKSSPTGHGTIPASAYVGSSHIIIENQVLKIGSQCPDQYCTGTLYKHPAGVIVVITGHAPLTSTTYEVEKLRCKLCETIYVAEVPFDYDIQKVSKVYDSKAVAIIALEKYGFGMPNHRLEQFQASLGVPVPDSTQWDKTLQLSKECGEPIFEFLEYCGAQGDISYRDDTTIKILSVINNIEQGEKGRAGTFSTGITSVFEGYIIQLYYNGVKHCGENFATLMEKRDPELGEMFCESDALSVNNPQSLSPEILVKLIMCYCLVHARRNFFKIKDFFVEECEYVLSIIAEVYKNEAYCKENSFDDFKRLKYHSQNSKPLMEELYLWLTEYIQNSNQFEENSSFGKAVLYFIKHWKKLTRFLYIAGAPLDNNIVERALRMVIRLRKASLFFKTLNGARVGSVLMSLIQTCNANNINPFHYLVSLQDNKKEVVAEPGRWLPWNYQDNTTVADVHIRDG